MTIQRMDHVGIVVDDLASAKAFFVELGLKLQGEGTVEGISHSQSTTSTPSSLVCERAAGSSLVTWRTTKTSIGSATSAGRRGSSSS